MTLILHRGAEPIDYDGLRALPVPDPTDTHVPIPHHRLVDLATQMLAFHGHEVIEQHHGVTPDGMRYFGVLTLKSPYHKHVDFFGLRNSHDKTVSTACCMGARILVCDNMSIFGDMVVRRKHCAQLKLYLPGLISGMVENLTEQRQRQARTFERYEQFELSEMQADHVILSLHRNQVLNLHRVSDVLKQWDTPTHDWGGKTAYRLFNCVTYTLRGLVAANPLSTRILHDTIDGVCEVVQ